MAFTPVEIIALIMVILFFVKMLYMYTNPRAWFSFTKYMYSGRATTIIALVLGIVIGYYLFQELSIVQVFAVMAFMSALMVIGVTAFSKEIIALADKVLRKKVVQKAWPSTLIWVFLSLWVLWELFMR